MPSKLYTYKDKDKMKIYRKNSRNRNYARSDKFASNSGRIYTAEEDQLILEHSVTDYELAQIIGCNARSIQVRRSKLKRRMQ